MLKKTTISDAWFILRNTRKKEEIMLCKSGHDCQNPHVAPSDSLTLGVTLKWCNADGSNSCNALQEKLDVA